MGEWIRRFMSSTRRSASAEPVIALVIEVIITDEIVVDLLRRRR